MLARAGHESMEAENGKMGLELIFRSRPDLVITDVMMPEMDGVQMVKQVRAFFPDLPIIAVSGSDTAWAAAQTFGPTGWGSSTDSPLTQARHAGADITVGKPFEIRLLMDAVARLLARGPAAPEPLKVKGAPRMSTFPVAESPREVRNLYHVRTDRGRWAVYREGTERPVARTGDKEDAVFLAQQIAGRDTPARVVVHDQDGTVQAHWDFSGASTNPPAT